MAFLIRHLESILLGIFAVVSGSASFILSSMDTARLASFGPTARIYFEGTKQGLFVGSIILALACIAFVATRAKLPILLAKGKLWLDSLSPKKESLLVLSFALVLTFVSHAGNITSGYFALDDLLVGGLNNKVPFSEAVMTPYGNDHLFPLYRAEMLLTGSSAVPMSAFIFLSIALVPFCMYFVLKHWKIGILGRIAFIVLYAGATNWADHITGFYSMSLYPQIIFFFSVALFAFVKWKETKKVAHAVIFALAALCSIAIDTAGIWSIIALGMYLLFDHYAKRPGFSLEGYMRGFFSEYRTPAAILVSIAILYGAFFYITFSIIQPNTFLSSLSGENYESRTFSRAENWKPIPLIKNYFNYIANGVSLPLLFPTAPKILAHPAFAGLIAPKWNFIEALLIIGNILLLGYIWKKSDEGEKKLFIFLFLAMSLCAAMTVIARPNHSPIPDYDFRYAGSAFFFYIALLSLGASIYARNRGTKAITVAAMILISIFSLQEIFSFHEYRLKIESQARKADMIALKETLFPELVKLGKDAVVPNLPGSSISEIMPGPSLAQYLLFYNVKNAPRLVEVSPSEGSLWTGLVEEVSSVKNETSKDFVSAFKTSEVIQKYYADNGRMQYAATTSVSISSAPGTKEAQIRRGPFDPRQAKTLRIVLLTDDASGTFDLDLSYESDLGIPGEARIRIDDYTPYAAMNGKRAYSIEADLKELVLYDLSNTVSNLRIAAPDAKNAQIVSAALR